MELLRTQLLKWFLDLLSTKSLYGRRSSYSATTVPFNTADEAAAIDLMRWLLRHPFTYTDCHTPCDFHLPSHLIETFYLYLPIAPSTFGRNQNISDESRPCWLILLNTTSQFVHFWSRGALGNYSTFPVALKPNTNLWSSHTEQKPMQKWNQFRWENIFSTHFQTWFGVNKKLKYIYIL